MVMQNDIDILFKAGFLSSLDYYFANTLLEISKENNPIIKLSAALVSKTSRDGHICFDISQNANKIILLSDKQAEDAISDNQADSDNQIKIKLPGKEQWIKALKSSIVVGKDSDFPLVLDADHKLYLAKYFDYQKRIVQNISERIKNQSPHIDMSAPDIELDIELDKHFINLKEHLPDMTQGILTQREAVQKALQNNFLIISGGPGTGKTYITDNIATVFKNLSKTKVPARPVSIVNTAPTGKAASKLKAGVTIHRLLQIKPNAQITQKKTKKSIAADLVIIDEASMIDIALMTKLLEAIPVSCKVIIIGDKNQLGSIETGSVFADICRSESLDKFIVNLKFNFRSGQEKGINKLAKAINSGDLQEIENILIKAESKVFKDLSFIDINDSSEITTKFQNLIIKEYTPYLKENDLELAYKKLGNFKILCSHRKNLFGTNKLNSITEKILQSCQTHDNKQNALKSIVMITKNDYHNSLFNGDMGMVIKVNGKTKAVFMNETGDLQSFDLSELKAFEYAFAITVHKSQGSEFDHVLLILPPDASTLLTRELLYTAITRARKKVTIAGNINVIKDAAIFDSKKESGVTKLLNKAIVV